MIYSRNINYKYLREKKAKHLYAWYQKEFENKKNLDSFIYYKATILPLRKIKGDSLLFGRGGVVDENNNYVKESAINNRIQDAYEFSCPEKKELNVVYCGYLVNQWGHFLIEAVARLWFFVEKDTPSIDKYVFFTDYEKEIELSGNYKEFLELLGILDKIEIINKPTTYRCVIIPELAYKWRSYYSNSYKQIFEKVVSNVKYDNTWSAYEKIYFTRSALKNISSKEIGLDMLDDYFRRNNYKIVAPEKIKLSYLIYLIRNARVVASLSGSLPHNMLFARDEQKIIILERNILNNEIQVDINKLKELKVIYIDANIGIYPINLGYGPFIMTYHGRLEEFSKDYKYNPPQEKYLSKRFLKDSYKRYMKEYHKIYAYQWFMEDWEIQYTDYLKEAYDESIKYFGEYIYGYKPYRALQLFEWNYIKRLLIRLFVRNS